MSGTDQAGPRIAAGGAATAAGSAYADGATRRLHEAACPGCGCEPEVVTYYRRGTRRTGFHCSCGAVVIDGAWLMDNPFVTEYGGGAR